MKTYQRNENMEFGEQVLRGGVGLIMLEAVLLSTAMSPALIAGLSLTALYMAFTALTGWDPIYALGQAAQPHHWALKANLTPHLAHDKHDAAKGYKLAA